MYNITRGNTIPMKAILEHEEERFPVAVSTNISVRAYNEYRYIDAENVTVDQEEDGVLYFEIPPTLNTGIFGVEVKGNVNGVSWRTATDGVVKITGATQRNEGSEAVPGGDTYDIVMRVQLYKNQSSDKAIEEHNSDETSHPYILSELERIEGEIPALPEHIVTDASYVHTDNNYTTEEKTKLGNTYTIEQTDEAIEQAKEDVSWEAEEYDITEAGGIGTVSHPRGRVVYFSSVAVSYIRISPLPHNASTGISFKVIGTPTEDTDNFVRISARGSIIFRTSNRPTIFKAGVTYEVEYTYISHTNLGCVYLESWVGGTATVAYTGSYNDLSDKPTIPTVPTNVSAFTNDAGYLTQHQSLSDYVQKSQTAGLIKNDGTIDTNTYLTQHQDISGKADKSEMSVTDGTGADADKTTITLKSGTSATVLKSHQSLSGKQDVIDSSHKLSADLVDDTNTTNKFTNVTEKQTWNGKQDALVSGTNIKTINNESVLGSGNISIDISGKEDVTTIVAPVNATDATLPITSLACEIGKYYRIDVAVETLAVTLPVMENITTTKTVVLYLTGGTTPAVTISSTAPTGGSAPDVYYQDGFEIEAGKTYEVNCLWNGLAWIVASVEIVTNNGE